MRISAIPAFRTLHGKRAAPSLLQRFLAWQNRMHERAVLYGMDEHILRDIGLSRADLEAESSKPFWRV